jgi:hypothetical protein
MVSHESPGQIGASGGRADMSEFVLDRLLKLGNRSKVDALELTVLLDFLERMVPAKLDKLVKLLRDELVVTSSSIFFGAGHSFIWSKGKTSTLAAGWRDKRDGRFGAFFEKSNSRGRSTSGSIASPYKG